LQVYVVSLASQSLVFAAHRGPDGKPEHTNKVYDKLSEGDMMLSPFALWRLKLSGPSLRSELPTFKVRATPPN
jgi:hypothetical protein